MPLPQLPVISALAAGGRLAIGEPAFELRPRHALRLGDLSVGIGNGYLKDMLGQIHGNGRSIHDVVPA